MEREGGYCRGEDSRRFKDELMFEVLKELDGLISCENFRVYFNRLNAEIVG